MKLTEFFARLCQRRCRCKNWKPLTDKLGGYIEFARIHGLCDWKGNPTFRYCPWCGRLKPKTETFDE